MLDGLKSAARRVSNDLALRTLVHDSRRLLSERGEANSVAIARELVARYAALAPEQQGQFFMRLAEDFGPDPEAVLAAAEAYAADPSPAHLARLTTQVEAPRQELLRRINRTPGGTASIVDMRTTLLGRVAKEPALEAVEADFLHLLSSWFNPGFLQLHRVDWNSPAQLLEQLIRHEAVHAIDGWDDLRRRLQPDRRCFAFFHPQLPSEPLIFVEVALLDEMPDAIAPLIAKAAPVADAARPRVAAFYSISNCQPGLRGVSLGNFLIKRVAEELKSELPSLRTFCTLSPIPGFARWVRGGVPCDGLSKVRAERLEAAHQALRAACDGDLDRLTRVGTLRNLDEAGTAALLRLGAYFLGFRSAAPEGDPVARFHLDNGARLERLNAQADLSSKALTQSFGLMVNYLYDLDRIEAQHEQFTQGTVAQSRAVAALL